MTENTTIEIGVFLCHCGEQIAEYLDMPALEEFTKGLPSVMYVEHQPFSCSQEGFDGIKNAIREQSLDRVVVAACTPWSHEEIFRSVCKEAGLAGFQYTHVHIREQCAWLRRWDKEPATAEAKEIIEMGVTEASSEKEDRWPFPDSLRQ